jgi:hypothetical protein
VWRGVRRKDGRGDEGRGEMEGWRGRKGGQAGQKIFMYVRGVGVGGGGTKNSDTASEREGECGKEGEQERENEREGVREREATHTRGIDARRRLRLRRRLVGRGAATAADGAADGLDRRRRLLPRHLTPPLLACRCVSAHVRVHVLVMYT